LTLQSISPEARDWLADWSKRPNFKVLEPALITRILTAGPSLAQTICPSNRSLPVYESDSPVPMIKAQEKSQRYFLVVLEKGTDYVGMTVSSDRQASQGVGLRPFRGNDFVQGKSPACRKILTALSAPVLFARA
jgi:hypothetical protein